MKITQPQLVIFDCDGVLVNTEPISNRIIADLAQKMGVNITHEEAIENFAGSSLPEVIRLIEKRAGKSIFPDFVPDYRRLSFEAFRNELEAISNIRHALQHIGQAKCVASNGPLNKIELVLEVTNLASFFNGNLFSAYQVNAFKPSPDLFLHAAKTMGYAPKRCVIVEDSLFGVKAARAAGIKVFGYPYDAAKAKELEREGAIVFDDMKMLPNLLNEQ